jgi:hypothetical protein
MQSKAYARKISSAVYASTARNRSERRRKSEIYAERGVEDRSEASRLLGDDSAEAPKDLGGGVENRPADYFYSLFFRRP